MAGQFFPPPPQFVGGHQPYAAPTPDPFGVVLTSPPPPVHPPIWPETQSRIVLSWFFPPPLPPVQKQGAITNRLPQDPPPFGLKGTIQAQNIAIAAWQPPPPAPYQKSPTAIFYPPPKTVVITPPPPVRPVSPIFPHDEDDDGYSFWRNTRRESEAARLKRMRQEIGLLPPDPVEDEAEQIQELLDDPAISTEFIIAQLSAHYYAKYQTALRQAQARADLARETARKRQDFYLSSAERAVRTEQGKRIVLKKLIEEDDARVMAMIEELLN